MIKYPLSVINKIDGKRVKVKDAFSWVLNYYDPNKKILDKVSSVLDSTCSEMLMWKEEDLNKFEVITNDISESILADYHYSCSSLDKVVSGKFDIIIYDPPYIDLANRKDTEKYERAFNYSSMRTIKDIEKLTIDSSYAFYNLLTKNGILIAKITDFHFKDRLYGHHNFINWFDKFFYLWDIIIYRFFKHIPNLNWYNIRCAKTHSYFLIFKKKKKKEIF